MLSNKRKKRPSRLSPAKTPSNVIFYWYRPLGAVEGTVRLGVYDSNHHRRSFWALAHSWNEIYSKESNETVLLELEGDAWDQVHDWEEVVQRSRALRSFRGVCFLRSNMTYAQQSLLLCCMERLQRVELNYFGSYEILKCIKTCCDRLQVLSVRHGAVLATRDARIIAEMLQDETPLRSLSFDKIENDAWNLLYCEIETSRTLERLQWKQIQLDTGEYLQVKQGFNCLGRILKQQVRLNKPIYSKDVFEDRLETIDSAIHVLQEWWRSTHRPVAMQAPSATDGSFDTSLSPEDVCKA